MTQPILVLAEGTYRYTENRGLSGGLVERTARVFVVEYRAGDRADYATIIFREPAALQNAGPGGVPAGAIREVLAADHDREYGETYLTLDVDR